MSEVTPHLRVKQGEWKRKALLSGQFTHEHTNSVSAKSLAGSDIAADVSFNLSFIELI